MKRYLSKKKALRLKWSRNANAAKARKRREDLPPEPEPSLSRASLPWEITVRNLIDGESASFIPRSGRHAKAVLDVLFANYLPSPPSPIPPPPSPIP
jgi:hypothetical protein